MLKKLIVERFKSIRSATLEFGRVNIFIGGNGAGKSNILEAIGVLSAAVDRGLGDLGRKGVRLTPPELMKSAFKNSNLPRTLKLTAELDDDVEYRVSLTGKKDDPLLAFSSEICEQGQDRIFGRSPNGAKAMGESIDGGLDRHRSIWDQVRTVSFPDTVARVLQGLSQYAIYAPQTDFLRGLTRGNAEMLPIGLHGEGLPDAVR